MSMSLISLTKVTEATQRYLKANLPLAFEDSYDSEFERLIAGAMLEIRVGSHELIRSNDSFVRLLAVTFEETKRENELVAMKPILVVELANIRHGKSLTLNEFIENRSEIIPAATKHSLISDLLQGMLALHSIGVIHSDIKPENVLIFGDEDEKICAKFSDFGFCWLQNTEDNPLDGATPIWAAPEQLGYNLVSTDREDAGASLSSSALGRGELYKYHQGTVSLSEGIRTKRDFFSLALLLWYLLLEKMPYDLGDRPSWDKIRTVKREDNLRGKLNNDFESNFHVTLDGDQMRQIFPNYSEIRHDSLHYWSNELSKQKEINAVLEIFKSAKEQQWDSKRWRWTSLTSKWHHYVRLFIYWNIAMMPSRRMFSLQTLLSLINE